MGEGYEHLIDANLCWQVYRMDVRNELLVR